MTEMPGWLSPKYVAEGINNSFINYPRGSLYLSDIFNNNFVDSTSILFSDSLCKKLINKVYSDNCKGYYEALDRFGLLSPPPFDIRVDIKANYIDPTSNNWNSSNLLQNCCGYGITIPPIALHSFYNAIANGGKYSNPYLSESLERSGKVKDKIKGNKLTKQIISESTALVINTALMNNIATGTAANQFKDTNTLVAGATGISMISVDGNYNYGQGHKYNYSFIGYFPADNPLFSILVMCSTFTMKDNTMQSGLQAEIANQVVDTLYNMNPRLIYR